MKKRLFCAALSILVLLSCTACGSGGYGIKTVETLVEQEYSLAFRVGDPTEEIVTACLETLAAEGKIDELTAKWFGERIIDFDRKANALEQFETIDPRTLIIGVDINSFPMVYLQQGEFWGFDVELAIAVCDRLGWELKIQPIEKENVYIELSSGNIDVAWGGIALNQEEVDEGLYSQYGPYVHNDIVIAVRDGEFVYNSLMLRGKRMAMSSTTEALEALNSDEKLAGRFGQITRLAGGTTECFQYLFSGKCDAVLTDTTAIYYFNCH